MTTRITQDGTARAEVRRIARATLVQCGTLTARFRLTPTFIIAGAQRCATTSLFRMLAEHPHVNPPLLQKGIHYFDTPTRYSQGMDFYIGHFPIRRPWKRGAITGEASPYYLFHPLAIKRLATDVPRAHVIVLLRDPVERAFSAYKQEHRRGFEPLASFEEALDAEPGRLAGEEDRLEADPSYRSFAHQHFGYIARGQYTRQLRRAEAFLGRERLTIIDLDALLGGDLRIWDDLLSRIDLKPWRPDDMIRANAAPSDDMRPTTRARLESAFEKENENLAAFLGYTPSWCA